MRNLFSLKVLGKVDIKKVPLSSFNSICQAGLARKAQFAENGRGGWYKKPTLTQYVRWGFFV